MKTTTIHSRVEMYEDRLQLLAALEATREKLWNALSSPYIWRAISFLFFATCIVLASYLKNTES